MYKHFHQIIFQMLNKEEKVSPLLQIMMHGNPIAISL